MGSGNGYLGIRLVLTLAVASVCTACTTSMHAVPAGVVTNGQTRTFHRVLVVTSSGYQRTLINAELRSDSLVGTLADSTKGRVAIPVTDISRMESEEHDPAPGVKAVAGFFGGVIGGLIRGMGNIVKCTFTRC